MKIIKPCAVFILLCGGAFAAQPQGTAFTYQGRMTDDGSPATGIYDLRFTIHDLPSGGNVIGAPLTKSAVGASNGLFTVALDFGGSPFTGPPRWLQISLSTNGAGSFITLAPRQEITRAPYATFANTAATVTNGAIANAQLALNAVGSANLQNSAVSAGKIASGQVVKSLNGLTDAVSLTQGANVTINTVGNSLQISAPAGGLALPFSGTAFSSNSIFTLANSGTGPVGVFLGNVGIGTSAPDGPLHVSVPVPVFALQDSDNGVSGQVGLVSFRNNAGFEGAWLGFGSSGNANAAFMNNRPGGNTALGAGGLEWLNVTSSGNVGVGTTTPQAKLDVRGDIHARGSIALGQSAELSATSGEENLRIVRGQISETGAVVHGFGFTALRNSLGNYRILFNTPFAGIPTVVATAHRLYDSKPTGIESLWVAGTDGVGRFGVVIVIRSLNTADNAGGWDDHSFEFIAIGPR